MSESIRMLVVEDSEDDAALLVRELTRAGFALSHKRVWSAGMLEESLAHNTWDLVISDHSLPGFSGTDALHIVRAREPNLPFIFVSGSIGEDTAVAAMRAGAQDYVMKGKTARLIPAIRRTLQESQARHRERITEEQLRSAGELIRSVFAASPLAIVATDLSGDVTLWNPAAERLFGWTQEEVIGKKNPVVPLHARESIEARRMRATQGELLGDLEATRVRKDGSMVDVSVTVAATYDRGDRPDGITVVYQDMTERKQLQAQFLQAQKMEAVGRLAGGVAHDFNNLLTVITSYTDLLQESVQDDGARRDLAAIRQAAEAATALTRQLLSFSRQRVLEPKVVALGDVVAGAAKLATRLLGASITLVEKFEKTTGIVKVDPGHVEQIVMNLLVNARDAMPKGGKLFISTRHADSIASHTGERVVSNDAGYALLSVRDTGTGMDAATQARIFEPFFTTKPIDRGTGLGLATVYGLVKQYDGVVDVRSELGAGTTFDIYLPLYSASEP